MNDKLRRRAGRRAVQLLPAQQRQPTASRTSCATAASSCPRATSTTATRRTSRSSSAQLADGKGNATVYVGYRKLEPIPQDRRDFSACHWAPPTPATVRHVHLRRLRHHRARPVPALRPGRPDRHQCRWRLHRRRGRRRAPYVGGTDLTTSRRQLLPASGRALHRRRVRPLRHQRQASVYSEFMFMDDRTHRADRAERRVPRRWPWRAAVLRSLPGELRQPAAHAVRPRRVLRRRHRRGRHPDRHRQAQRRRRRAPRRSAPHLVPRRRRSARRHRRRLDVRRVRPVRHVDPRPRTTRTTSRARASASR